MREIAVLHGIPLLLQLLHDGSHVHGIPHDDGVGHQIEATGLMRQVLPTWMAQVPLVGNDQGGPQVVQRLAFVELPHDTPPVRCIGIPPHDMAQNERTCHERQTSDFVV